MCKIWRHDFGTVLAIGLESDNKEQIEQRFYSFWNHGATSGELHWISDNFGYFWTKPDNLFNSLVRSSLFGLLNVDSGKYKGHKKGLMPQAMELALNRWDEISYKAFIADFNPDDSTYSKPFKLGSLEWQTPDLNNIAS